MFCVEFFSTIKNLSLPKEYITQETQLSAKFEIMRSHPTCPGSRELGNTRSHGYTSTKTRQSRYNCEITSHPHKAWRRRYYLNREVLHWPQYSIAGGTLCGFIAILKTWHIHVKNTRMTSFLIHHQRANEKGVTRENI